MKLTFIFFLVDKRLGKKLSKLGFYVGSLKVGGIADHSIES